MISTTQTKMLSKPGVLLGILLVHILPVFGIFFAGWDWREIVIFYWLGNITIGVLTLMSLIRSPSIHNFITSLAQTRVANVSTTDVSKLTEMTRVIPEKYMKLFSAGFFCIQYGFFTFVHGVFVFAITSNDVTINGAPIGSSDQSSLNIMQILSFWLVAFVIQVVYELKDAPKEVSIPAAYTRILVLHTSLIIGVFLISLLQWPAVAAVSLVVVSFLYELSLHKSQKKPVLESNTNLPGTI